MPSPLERWSQLRSSRLGDQVGDIATIDSGVETGFGTARYAIGLLGEPRLLVPVAARHPGKLPSSGKLSVNVISIAMAAKNVFFIDIMSLDRALDPVFAELAVAILRRVDDGDSPQSAVANAIRDFRELLREPTRPKVDDSTILGLVGELFILNRLVSINTNAINAWVGPLGQRHDFKRSAHGLEVKTSNRLDSTIITIHGIDQLAAPEGGTLALAHVRTELAEDGGLSVSALVRSLESAGADLSKLQQRLSQLGCLDPHAPEWNRLMWAAPVYSMYDVGPGFPRVIHSSFSSGSLPAGINAMQYCLDVTHAAAFRLTDDESHHVLETIAG